MTDSIFKQPRILARVKTPRGAMRPGFGKNHPPLSRRAWGMPGAQCARSLVCELVGKMHTSIHSEFTGNARHSRTQWFYSL
jgi:hypothetical protein